MGTAHSGSRFSMAESYPKRGWLSRGRRPGRGAGRPHARPRSAPQSVRRDDLGRKAPASISRSKAPVSPSTAYSYTAAE